MLRILLLAFVYFIAGRLSLMLAIPPGFVTAIFLPIGISIGAVIIWGYRFLLGVFLGSCLLNYSLAGSDGFSLIAILIATEIAAASTLAVAAAVFLVNLKVKFPSPLMDEKEIFWFLFLSGPVACLISGALGPLVLLVNGAINAGYYFNSAWTWWVGDSIGALIGAPLMCILFASPKTVWRSRFKTVGVPVVITSILVIFVFIRTSNEEQARLVSTFQQQAKSMTAEIVKRYEDGRQMLLGVRALYMASDDLTRADFARYVEGNDIASMGISAVSWNKLIFEENRPEYERGHQINGFPDFSIMEISPDGNLEVAPSHKSYVVIEYIEPWSVHSAAFGLNISAEPRRREALSESVSVSKPVMTEPIVLVQETKPSLSTLMFLPVYQRDVNEFNNSNVKGFITVVMRAEDIINSSLKGFDANSYRLFIEDVVDPLNPIALFGIKLDSPSIQQKKIGFSQIISVAGRDLSINIFPSQTYIDKNTGASSWFVLAGGLLFTGLLGAFLLFISGVTENVKSKVLEQTQELSSILSNALEAILVISQEGKIMRANPAAAKLFGYSLATLYSTNVKQLIPELANHFNNNPQIIETIFGLDTDGLRNNGQMVRISLSLSHLPLEEKDFYTLIIHDISERDKVDRLKREFISTVSHELRTPLTSIKGALGVSLSGSFGEVPPKIQSLLTIASNNSDRLVRLINDILDIDKLEFGKLEFKLVKANLYSLLREAMQQSSSYGVKFQVEIRLMPIDKAYEDVCVLVDVDRFLQVMANLLSNAIKYSSPGSYVDILMVVDSGKVKVSVRDWGEGISEEFRNRIFQRFAQADSSDTRKREGTGLGLSISKTIVERFGGTMDYSSTLGVGSEFYFELPQYKQMDENS